MTPSLTPNQHYDDPLLKLLQPYAPEANFFTDDTSEAMADSRQGFTEVRTGYADVNEVEQVTMFDGKRVITDWFGGSNITVSGNSGWVRRGGEYGEDEGRGKGKGWNRE